MMKMKSQLLLSKTTRGIIGKIKWGVLLSFGSKSFRDEVHWRGTDEKITD